MEVTKSEGRFDGPAFGSPDGLLASHSEFDASFRTYLEKVQDKTNLIDKGRDIAHMYGISRTPISRAKRAGYDQDKLDEMNRWRSLEKAQTRKTRHKMNMLYSEAVLMMPYKS